MVEAFDSALNNLNWLTWCQSNGKAPFLQNSCIIVSPFCRHFLKPNLIVPIQFLQCNDIRCLLLDPVGTLLNGFLMIEPIQHIPIHYLQGLCLLCKGAAAEQAGRDDHPCNDNHCRVVPRCSFSHLVSMATWQICIARVIETKNSHQLKPVRVDFFCILFWSCVDETIGSRWEN